MATPSTYDVRLGTAQDTSATLVEKGYTNVRMMTGNVLFPTPNPTLAVVEAACDTLAKASETYAFTRSKLDKEARDIAHANLLDLRKQLAWYVQDITKGNREEILSAGFDVRRVPTPVGLLPAPKNLYAAEGVLPGTIEVRWSGVRNRQTYRLEMAIGDPNEEANWRVVLQNSKNRHVVAGLTSDTVYTFRVSALSNVGFGPASDVAQAKAK